MGRGERPLHQNLPVNATSVDAGFAALADPQRRRIIELLGERPRRAGELAQEVGVSPPALSRHLRTLKKGGLVDARHPEFDARVRIYALRKDGMKSLKIWMERAEGMWTRQLAAFKEHVENDQP